MRERWIESLEDGFHLVGRCELGRLEEAHRLVDAAADGLVVHGHGPGLTRIQGWGSNNGLGFNAEGIGLKVCRSLGFGVQGLEFEST
jgi:hypothetical protein